MPIRSIVLGGLLRAESYGGIEPSFRIATVSKTSARSAVFGWDSRLTVCLLVHMLARLAITATCANSAAALNVQAGSSKIEMSFLHQQFVGVSNDEFSIGDRRGQALQQPGTDLAHCATRWARHSRRTIDADRGDFQGG